MNRRFLKIAVALAVIAITALVVVARCSPKVDCDAAGENCVQHRN